MHYAHEFLELPGYWIEDLTPPPSITIPATERSVKLAEAIQIATLPIDRSDLALWRDQAAAALLFLSGARASAAVTLPVCAVHLDPDHPYIGQWPYLGVHTKNNQGANTFLHMVPELLEVVRAWDAFVREKYPPTSPWYAPISSTWGEQSLSTHAAGYHRRTALNKRLTRLFELAGLPHKSPHKFRHGHAIYGLERCQTMGEYHALSRNLMHESITTTDQVYTFMEEKERGKLLAGLNHRNLTEPDEELHRYLSSLSRGDLLRAINLAAALLAD
jgi:integrase